MNRTDTTHRDADALDRSAQTVDDRAFSFGDVVKAATRYWIIVLVLTVIGAIAGYLLATGIPDRFTAEATLISDTRGAGIIDIPGEGERSIIDPSMTATTVETLSSPEVVRRAIDTLSPEMRETLTDVATEGAETPPEEGGGDISAALQRHVSSNLQIMNSGRSYVIRARFVSTDPRLSAAMANAIVDAYLAYRAELRGRVYEQRLSDLGKELESLSADLRQSEETAQTIREQVRVLANRSEALMGGQQDAAIEQSSQLYANQRQAEREAEATASVYERLLFTYRDIQSRLVAPEQSVQLFSQAPVPTRPSGSSTKILILGLGLFCGLFGGLSLAVFLWSRRSPRPTGKVSA